MSRRSIPLPVVQEPSPKPLSAMKKRALQPLFPALWSVAALRAKLPLPFPAPWDAPPSPKRCYRSCYEPPHPDALDELDRRSSLSPFEVALRLIDFSPLRNVLAQTMRPTARGQVPFDPVSLFLVVLLGQDHQLGPRALARLLAGEHGAGWRRMLGFTQGHTPSESGLRYAKQRLNPALLERLAGLVVALLLEQGLVSTRSTLAGDPPHQGVSVAQDGMLHEARDQHHCWQATDACYQPLAVDPATGVLGRPCRAREHGREGCACTTSACATRCERASVRDAEARLIVYERGNDKHGRALAAAATGKKRAAKATRAPARSASTPVFGYRSVVDLLIDDRSATALVLYSTVYPANTDERTVMPEHLRVIQRTFPDLPLGEWIADSGTGYEPCLQAIYDAGALRMVDIRGDRGDEDPRVCLRRGYNGNGQPLCPHGYLLSSNGYDRRRRRRKYVCGQRCRHQPRNEGDAITPVLDCPYADPSRSNGQVVNVGRTMPDHSMRLARDILPGSPEWKRRYGRRNLTECRNSQIEHMGLKHLSTYGLERATRTIWLADCLVNLRGMGRMVLEASALVRRRHAAA